MSRCTFSYRKWFWAKLFCVEKKGKKIPHIELSRIKNHSHHSSSSKGVVNINDTVVKGEGEKKLLCWLDIDVLFQVRWLAKHNKGQKHGGKYVSLLSHECMVTSF